MRVTLPPVERALLLDMAAAIRGVIADHDADTPPTELTGRLFPRAYEDPLDQMQFAESMMGPLVEGKRTMLDTFEQSLVPDLAQTAATGRRTGADRPWTADLDGDQVAAWLAVLQDGRQVLATVVGITEESDWQQLEDPSDDSEIVLAYLGDILHSMVVLLMGDMDEADE